MIWLRAAALPVALTAQPRGAVSVAFYNYPLAQLSTDWGEDLSIFAGRAGGAPRTFWFTCTSDYPRQPLCSARLQQASPRPRRDLGTRRIRWCARYGSPDRCPAPYLPSPVPTLAPPVRSRSRYQELARSNTPGAPRPARAASRGAKRPRKTLYSSVTPASQRWPSTRAR